MRRSSSSEVVQPAMWGCTRSRFIPYGRIPFACARAPSLLLFQRGRAYRLRGTRKKTASNTLLFELCLVVCSLLFCFLSETRAGREERWFGFGVPIPTATWRWCCKLCKIGKWGVEVCASRELFCGGRGRWNVAGRCGGCRILSSKEIGRSFLFCFFAACLFVSLLSSRILQRGRKGIGKGEWEEADFGGWRFRLGSCDREWFYGVSDVAGVVGGRGLVVSCRRA